MAGVGDLKRICTDAFFVAGAVQEASSAEMFGTQGADFLRGVAFWRIKSSALPRCYFVTGAAFRDTAWKNRKTHWYEAVSCTVNFPFLKEVSQNRFVFDVFNCKK